MDTSGRLRVVLVGGSGLLGRGMRERLVGDGHPVAVIGRGPAADHEGWQELTCDARSLGPWTRALEEALARAVRA